MRDEALDDPNCAVAAHLAHLERAPSARGSRSQRKAQGSHYTPRSLVEYVLRESTHELAHVPRSVIDPACGSGNFLVAAARELIARGAPSMESVLTHSIYGVDIDERAVELCRDALLALLLESTPIAARDRVAIALERHVVCADAIELDFGARIGIAKFDWVLGNPPFLNQLEISTAHSRTRAKRIAQLTGGAVSRYTDVAAAFLLLGLDLLAPGGRLGFVMPQSFLASADARKARDAAVKNARLRSVWACTERMFDGATVQVCAITLSKQNDALAASRDDEHDAASVCVAFGVSFDALPVVHGFDFANTPTWSPLIAAGFGVPACVLQLKSTRVVGEIARATADFRDQFYGLRGAIVERAQELSSQFPRLVTTKHIGLAECTWGAVNVRVHGIKHVHPCVDRAALERDSAMNAWVHTRLIPKILVATQTRVMEAWVDEEGSVLPLVPLLTVVARDDGECDLWMIAAALASPVIAARAVALYSGSALSSRAIKLSARQLVEMPLPIEQSAWQESAQLFRDASRAPDLAQRNKILERYAHASIRAYGLGKVDLEDVLRFWRERRVR